MDGETCARTDAQWPGRAVQRWPMLARCPEALEWVRIQADLRLAPRTLEAYARGLADYLTVCGREEIDPLTAGRAEIARYVRGSGAAPEPSGRGDCLDRLWGGDSRTPRCSSAWSSSGSSMIT